MVDDMGNYGDFMDEEYGGMMARQDHPSHQEEYGSYGESRRLGTNPFRPAQHRRSYQGHMGAGRDMQSSAGGFEYSNQDRRFSGSDDMFDNRRGSGSGFDNSNDNRQMSGSVFDNGNNSNRFSSGAEFRSHDGFHTNNHADRHSLGAAQPAHGANQGAGGIDWDFQNRAPNLEDDNFPFATSNDEHAARKAYLASLNDGHGAAGNNDSDSDEYDHDAAPAAQVHQTPMIGVHQTTMNGAPYAPRSAVTPSFFGHIGADGDFDRRFDDHMNGPLLDSHIDQGDQEVKKDG